MVPTQFPFLQTAFLDDRLHMFKLYNCVLDSPPFLGQFSHFFGGKIIFFGKTFEDILPWNANPYFSKWYKLWFKRSSMCKLIFSGHK